MTLSRQLLLITFVVFKLHATVGNTDDFMDWRNVEALAEEYPYVVGLLNVTKDYMCTGVIINKGTVLTSGSCIEPALHFIAIGHAVLSRDINNKGLFKIAGTLLHADYIYELKAADPNVTQMHSNIGLVFSVEPYLETFFPGADLGNYFAPELAQQSLKVVGYGRVNGTNLAILQHQVYQQTPCTNPKWYYCVCGFEFSSVKTYEPLFGEGAPVFLHNDVVGVTAAPCGSLDMRNKMLKYNIFTILGPYLRWIDKNRSNFSALFRTGTISSAKQMSLHSIFDLLFIIRVFLH